MKTPEARLAWAMSRCEQARLRVTPARRAILTFLAAHRDPAGLDLLAQAAGIRGLWDATTIYRTLMMFKDAAMVHEVGSHRKTSHFVLNVPDDCTHFLICERCGLAVETELGSGVAKSLEQIASTHSFSPNRQHVEVHGLCAACASARQGEGTTCKLAVQDGSHKNSKPYAGIGAGTHDQKNGRQTHTSFNPGHRPKP